MQSVAAGVVKGCASRAECDEAMALCNGRLASARSERARLEASALQSESACREARERRADVLHSLARRNGELYAGIEDRQARKRQLFAAVTAHRATWDAVWERRRAQYERALASVRSDRAFEESKYRASAEKNRHRAALMVSLSTVSALVDDIEEQHRQGLYAADQSWVCRHIVAIHEQEKAIADMFETVIMNHKCDKTDVMRNITESYDTVKGIVENRNKYLKIRTEFAKAAKRHSNVKLNLQIQLEEIKKLKSLIRALDYKKQYIF